MASAYRGLPCGVRAASKEDTWSNSLEVLIVNLDRVFVHGRCDEVVVDFNRSCWCCH